MDPTYNDEAEAYRKEVRAFLDAHLPAGWRGAAAMGDQERETWTAAWRQTLAANGLRAVAWPAEYGGGGLSPLERVILAEEFTRVDVPLEFGNDGFGFGLLGPTIIARGTEEQKRRFLPRIISGEDRWCQGYSEPGAGSDLAGLSTRAVLDGDEWVINGQKIWTSSAQTANWIFVLARTSPDAPKHKGITFFLVPMDQPGIEVRPIKEMTGHALFNETFFTDARTAKENVIGEVDEGWAVANTLLGFERGGRATVMSISYRKELDALIELARERGRNRDPVIRDRLAWAHTQVELIRFLGMRTLTRALAGDGPGPESSIFKLLWSEYHKKVTEAAVDILGADALAPSGPPPSVAIGVAEGEMTPASVVGTFLGARAGTIYAGTSQVQRNIIGERVLGLPREPRADSGPWNELLRT
ncbi:MAG: acyl-CoA dehydrogenase family protein [Acidimicrobiales bacterium]|nr:acyl-CoA dehydrogenase family protein [Acidimicrobiales bacterium]